jgi:hypothetical protein
MSAKKCQKKPEKFLKIYSTRGGKARVHADIKSVAKKPIFIGFDKFSIGKISFWLKLFLGALFTKVICTFFKSVRKDGFFDAPFDIFKEKKVFISEKGQ